MQRYRNSEGATDVTGFEIGLGTITLEFADGQRVLCTAENVGPLAVAEMQALAKAGERLSPFLVSELRARYAQAPGTDNHAPVHDARHARRMAAQEELRQMKGTVAWEGDLDAMRTDK